MTIVRGNLVKVWYLWSFQLVACSIRRRCRTLRPVVHDIAHRNAIDRVEQRNCVGLTGG
jgi:hypothetical protein